MMKAFEYINEIPEIQVIDNKTSEDRVLRSIKMDYIRQIDYHIRSLGELDIHDVNQINGQEFDHLLDLQPSQLQQVLASLEQKTSMMLEVRKQVNNK